MKYSDRPFPSFPGPLYQNEVNCSAFDLDLMQIKPQVAQARNMSIGEHRHCCVTFKIQGKPLYREKTVDIKTHKTAISLPVDHTGET